MATVLDITPQRVRIGNGTNTLFDTNNGYLVKEENLILPSNQDKIFTRTLSLNGKQIVPEVNTIENLNRPYRTEDWGDYYSRGRDQTRPGTTISRPFLEFYTYNGSPETRFYCFLLLVDISPLRQGFYQFFIQNQKFFGFVRKLEKYDHYNWQRTGISPELYSWVKQPQPLGYGVEVYPGDLYYNFDEDLGDAGAVKRVAEKPLLQFLRNLRGGEEIVSSVSPVNPGFYDTRIHSLPLGFFQPGEDGNSDVFSYSEGYDLLKLSPTDALSYVASYPDLIAAYVSDSQPTWRIIQNAQNHWIRNAAKDGRTISFNPIAYINKYSDMKQQYTTSSSINALGATEHFIRFGFAEGRNLEGASTFYPNSRGALYDERFGSVDISDEFIVYPNGQTIAGKGNSLTYRFNNTIYYLNGNLPTNEKTIFLKKQ